MPTAPTACNTNLFGKVITTVEILYDEPNAVKNPIGYKFLFAGINAASYNVPEWYAAGKKFLCYS